MKKTTLLLCAGIVSAGVAFAADVDLSKLPAPSTKKGLTFAKDLTADEVGLLRAWIDQGAK